MSEHIQRLPTQVANQIAAGEVVQRPASVVKELLENAVDSGADQIQLILKEAGRSLIQVVDNGSGMGREDALICFERHATSKIRRAEDLFDLHTMGFRGEALAAIGAVAQVSLSTRSQGEELGHEVACRGGEIRYVGLTPCEQGTSVSVKNLFYNIPARRQFLKSNSVELKHIVEEFFRVALVHPEISFRMYHNGEQIYELYQGPLRQRIDGLYGKVHSERLIPVEEVTGVVTVSGFVVRPEHARKQRGYQYLFVNGRFFRSTYLHHAVRMAFEGLISEEHHPGYYLYLEVDPAKLDVNIHPTKTEVKFEDEATIYAILRSAVRHGLGKFHLGPTLDFQRDPSLDLSFEERKSQPESPGIRVDYNFNPFLQERSEGSASSGRNLQPTGTAAQKQALSQMYSEAFSSLEIDQLDEVESEKELALFPDVRRWSTSETECFQWNGRYLVVQAQDTVYFVDQNRAHERVLYECFLAEMTVQQGSSQRLIFPLEIELDRRELDALDRFYPYLEHMGFSLEDRTSSPIRLTGLPAVVPESTALSLMQELLGQEADWSDGAAFSEAEYLARRMSRKLAVPPGVVLQGEAARTLLRDLLLCKEPQWTPYGKLVYIRVTSEEIEKKFK